MSNISLTDLGITPEELRQRVVDKIAGDIMSDECFESDLQRKVSLMLKEKVDAAVTALGDRVVAPRIAEMLEDLCLQQTNLWGERTGKALTFIEYLTQRAEGYMTEKVNAQGKTAAECKSSRSSFSAAQSRVAFMVDSHLQYSIKTAMEKALAEANSQIAAGITDTVKQQMSDILGRVKATVTVK